MITPIATPIAQFLLPNTARQGSSPWPSDHEACSILPGHRAPHFYLKEDETKDDKMLVEDQHVIQNYNLSVYLVLKHI